MKALSTAAVLAALCCTAVTVFAEGPDELWEVTMKMEMAGMPAMPARTQNVCNRKGNPDATKMGDKDSECKVSDKKQSGNKSSWKFTCTKPTAMTGTGEVTYSGDTYQGIMTMVSDDMNMKQTFSGRKVGSCTYEEPAKKVEAIQAQSKAAIAKECDKQIEGLHPMMIFGGANVQGSQGGFLCALGQGGAADAGSRRFLRSQSQISGMARSDEGLRHRSCHRQCAGMQGRRR